MYISKDHFPSQTQVYLFSKWLCVINYNFSYRFFSRIVIIGSVKQCVSRKVKLIIYGIIGIIFNGSMNANIQFLIFFSKGSFIIKTDIHIMKPEVILSLT